MYYNTIWTPNIIILLNKRKEKKRIIIGNLFNWDTLNCGFVNGAMNCENAYLTLNLFENVNDADMIVLANCYVGPNHIHIYIHSNKEITWMILFIFLVCWKARYFYFLAICLRIWIMTMNMNYGLRAFTLWTGFSFWYHYLNPPLLVYCFTRYFFDSPSANLKMATISAWKKQMENSNVLLFAIWYLYLISWPIVLVRLLTSVVPTFWWHI